MWQSLNDEDYFRQPNTYGSGNLKAILKSPAHAQLRIEQTSAMALGIIVHEYVLQGIEPIIQPKFDMRTNAGKAAAAEFAEQHKGTKRRYCTQDDFDTAQRARDALHAIPSARIALERKTTIFEQPGLVQEDDFKLRIKPDARNAEFHSLFELKTIAQVSGDAFARSATNLMYFLQAAFYFDIANRIDKDQYNAFFFLVAETSEPYGARIFELDQSGIELGREQYKKGLQILKKCRKENKWPLYSKEIEILVPPPYAMYWNE